MRKDTVLMFTGTHSTVLRRTAATVAVAGITELTVSASASGAPASAEEDIATIDTAGSGPLCSVAAGGAASALLVLLVVRPVGRRRST
jgi:hypothetical protein